jgi:hypothetical protein
MEQAVKANESSENIMVPTVHTDDTQVLVNNVEDATSSSTNKLTEKKIVNGVGFSASNFRPGQGSVFVDVCYDLPGKGVWDINQAALQYVGGEASDFNVQETSLSIATDDKMKGVRCMTLEFVSIPANADLSSITLEIRAIGMIAPPEGKECEEYNTRKKNADKKMAEQGIEVSCEQQDGMVQLKINKKPENMSEDKAYQLINKYLNGWTEGPWVFTGSISK